MLFCPTCGNMLLIESVGGSTRSFCNSCPYVYSIESTITTYVPIKKKKVADVLGQDWSNASKIAALCPKCSHKLAAYFQIQIRSADEPMTTFYKCMECGNQWNDD